MVGFNTPIHHDRITLIPEHRGKHDNIELSPYRAAFFGSYNASEYLEINAQIRIWLRSTPTSPKPTLSLPLLAPPTDHSAPVLLLEYFYWRFLEKSGLYRQNLESLQV
jgi:hypothetical protein